MFLVGAILWLMTTSPWLQVNSEIYRMLYNPNVFDDQYIGCSDKLEKNVMPRVLQKEKVNKQFKEAWINATERWEEIQDDLQLPEGFEDEYGIALLTYTNQYPAGNPIYQQLNGNLSIAGASQKDYMENFHFKALHFYLTRALQMLKPNCDVTYTTYRGSHHDHLVQPVFKFGRFTSSSLNSTSAQDFGTESLFCITTCFGARIGNLSFFPDEEEVLIPPTEKFQYIRNEYPVYILNSTGKMCSYFNCAYLGGEKQKDPVCRSETTQSMEETQAGSQPDMMSASELQERLSGLEDHISHNHLYWKHLSSELQNIQTSISGTKNLTMSLNSTTDRITKMKDTMDNVTQKMLEKVKRLTTIEEKNLIVLDMQKHQYEELRKDLIEQQDTMDNVAQKMVKELKGVKVNVNRIMDVLLRHKNQYEELRKDLTEQQDRVQALTFGLVTFGVTVGSIVTYKYWMRRPEPPR